MAFEAGWAGGAGGVGACWEGGGGFKEGGADVDFWVESLGAVFLGVVLLQAAHFKVVPFRVVGFLGMGLLGRILSLWLVFLGMVLALRPVLLVGWAVFLLSKFAAWSREGDVMGGLLRLVLSFLSRLVMGLRNCQVIGRVIKGNMRNLGRTLLLGIDKRGGGSQSGEAEESCDHEESRKLSRA